MTRLATIFAAVCTLAGTASADTYDHFDRIAYDIEQQAVRLVSEVRHYRHTPQYVHLVRDAYRMKSLARHAHQTAHVGCSLAHLEADVRQLDSTLHHIQDLVSHIDHGVAFGVGHAHGNAGHVHQLLHGMEANIHHLMSDLRQLRAAHGGHGHVGRGHWGHGGAIVSPQPTINRRIPAGWGNGISNGPTINRRIPAGWGNGMTRRPTIRFRWGF